MFMHVCCAWYPRRPEEWLGPPSSAVPHVGAGFGNPDPTKDRVLLTLGHFPAPKPNILIRYNSKLYQVSICRGIVVEKHQTLGFP